LFDGLHPTEQARQNFYFWKTPVENTQNKPLQEEMFCAIQKWQLPLLKANYSSI
jgi:hypothetical protein